MLTIEIETEINYDEARDLYVGIWSVGVTNPHTETSAAIGGIERARDLDLLVVACDRRIGEVLARVGIGA